MGKRFLTTLVVLAVVGANVRSHYHWHHVPVSRVDPDICMASGAVVGVQEWTGSPHVYHVHCARGPVMVTGDR